MKELTKHQAKQKFELKKEDKKGHDQDSCVDIIDYKLAAVKKQTKPRLKTTELELELVTDFSGS